MLPSDLCRSGNAGLIARPSASVKKCSALCARNRNGRCCEIRIGQRMVGGEGNVALLVKSPGAVANTPMVTQPIIATQTTLSLAFDRRLVFSGPSLCNAPFGLLWVFPTSGCLYPPRAVPYPLNGARSKPELRQAITTQAANPSREKPEISYWS
jgi:hypothetical protein